MQARMGDEGRKIMNYTAVPQDAVRHPEMTLTALGVLSWLLTQENTEGLSVQKMARNFREGGVVIAHSLNLLEDLGYLKRVKIHRNGRYQDGKYVATRTPFEFDE